MPKYEAPSSELKPGSIVDAYVRDSGGPRQDASTDQQLTEIQRYCQQYGLVLRHRFADVAKSGGSTVARDDFNRLIDNTRRPEDRPCAILLWNYARFARDLDDAIYYKALLRNRNVIVHSLTDPIPEGQYGRIIEFFIDISNEEKRRQTSTDAKRGLRDLVLNHGCVPGVPPRGFKRQAVDIGTRRDGSPRQAHRWVPDPDLVPRIQRAFQMRAGGRSLAEIHAETRLFGAINSYKGFYTNRLYIGILEFGDQVVENYCEPLIDMATWNAVQVRIQEHSQAKHDRLHPRRVHTPYLLSGLVYCGECGSIMSSNTVTANGQRGRNEAYRCSRSKRKAGCNAGRIGRRTLETAVLATLRDYILLPDTLSAMFDMEKAALLHYETRRDERLAVLNGDKKKISTQIANITRAIGERGHSQSLLDRLTELETRLADVRAEINKLVVSPHVQPPKVGQDRIEELSKNITNILLDAPAEKVHRVLLGFVHKVVVKKEEGQYVGTITYYTPPAEGPPFDDPPSSKEAGYNLPIGSSPLGAPTQTHPEPRSVIVEQFLPMLRFEQRGKLAELPPDRK